MQRRDFITSTLAVPFLLRPQNSGAMRIERISHSYRDFHYRAPYKFGAFAVDRVTLLNVECEVSLRNGRRATGFGSMTLGNNWSFPSHRLSYDETLAAMKTLASRIASIAGAYREFAHPIDIAVTLEPEYLKAAAGIELAEPIPKLCTLVTASPFDAALHDAFGKVHGRAAYACYDRDLLPNSLAQYLGPAYAGHWLDEFLLKAPHPQIPLFHSVGALDSLTSADLRNPVKDGLPETLADWIPYSGLDRIKIKLTGDDLNWDLDRVLNIDRVAIHARPNIEWFYSLDFNERCPNVEHLLEFIHKLKERNSSAFARIQYIEQPTARDLAADRRNDMHQAAALLPIVIDESLTGLDMLLLARDMGYTGIALKACKGQSQALLMAAAGQIHHMFLCVQDLTCPGASLIQSAGLAAHVPGIAGIEANAREYVPAANAEWVARFPGIFNIRNGRMAAESITGNGLGAVSE